MEKSGGYCNASPLPAYIPQPQQYTSVVSYNSPVQNAGPPASPLYNQQQNFPQVHGAQRSLHNEKPKVIVEVGKLSHDDSTKEKPSRYYNITLAVPTLREPDMVCCSWEIRFSRLVYADSKLPDDNRGFLPSRHAFSNFSTNEKNCAQRAREIQEYLSAMLNITKAMLSHSYLVALGIPDELVKQALKDIALSRNDHANELKRQERARKQAIEDHWDLLYRHAQNFKGVAPPGQMPILSYQQEMSFRMKEKWGWHDGTITGPNGRDWFKIDRSGFFDSSAKFTLMTMNNIPLMILKREYKLIGNRTYSLHRSGPSGTDLWCEVKRHQGFFTTDYDIISGNRLCRNVDMQGSWGTDSTTFRQNGNTVAKVSKEFTLFSGDNYTVTMMPNTDVIFFLALAAVIDKMHHRDGA